MKKILSFITAISIIFTMNTTFAALSSNAIIKIAEQKSVQVVTGEQYWVSASYKNYIYTLASATSIANHGLRIFDATTLNGITEVTDYFNEDIKGNATSSAPTQLICVQGDYLFVGFWTSPNRTVKMFDLSANPASPKLLKTFSFPNKRPRAIFAKDNYIYVAGEMGLVQIDYQTEVTKTITAISSNLMRYKDGKLFLSYGTVVEVYDIAVPSAVTKVTTIDFGNTVLETGKCDTVIDFELLDSGYLFAVGYNNAADWAKRWIMTVDISDLSKTAEKQIYVSTKQYTRLNTLIAEGSLVYAGDIDARFWIFDVSNPTAVTPIMEKSISGINLYHLSKCGNYFVSSNRAGGLYILKPVVLDLIAENTVLTDYPANISGSAIGAQSVEVAIGNYKVQAKLSDGKFTAELDSSILKNGTYTAVITAKADEEQLTREISVNVNLPAITDVVITKNMNELSGGNLLADFAITNHYSALNIYAVIGLYKNEELIKKQIKEISLTGRDVTNCNLSINISPGEETSSYVKAFLINKNNYDVLYSACILGSEPACLQPLITSSSSDLKLSVDMYHDARKADVNTAISNSTGYNYLYMVYKPGERTINNLQHIDVARGINNASRLNFTLPVNAMESQDYTVAVYVANNENKYTAEKTFQYYGEFTVNLVLTQIKNAIVSQMDNILVSNSNMFGINTSNGSPYDLLDDIYKAHIWSSMAGRDFSQSGNEPVKGAVGVKTVFNELVENQTALQTKDRDEAAAVLEINSAIINKDTSKVKIAIETQANAIGIDTSSNSVYKKLTDSGIGKLCNRFLKITSYTNVESIKIDFNEWVVLEYINQTPYTEMNGMYDDVCLSLGIKTSDKYKSFSTNEKSIFFKELSYQKDFESKQSFEDAIPNAETYVISNRKTSSVGGGSGRTTGSIVVPPVPVATAAPVQSEEPAFSDMTGFEWAQNAVDSLYQRKIINGKAKGQFSPDDDVTREEFVKMVVVAFELSSDNLSMKFNDINEDMWSYNYIKTAFANGIINGISETEFNPAGNITREDMTVIIYKIMLKSGVPLAKESLKFDDKDNIAPYAVDAVSTLVKLKVINGTSVDKFSPKENANRAQAAKIIFDAISARK